MPVDDRVYPHEPRPVAIRLLEMGEVSAMGVCPPRAYKDSFDREHLLQIFGKGLLHGLITRSKVEVILIRRSRHEIIDLYKWITRSYVNSLQKHWKGRGVARRERRCWCRRRRREVGRQRSQDEDKENEAILSAIVRDR
jgi:hypothetical protein